MQGSYSSKRLSNGTFVDLHFEGNETLIEEAKRLGYTDLVVTRCLEEYNSEFLRLFDDLNSSHNINLKKGVEITCKNSEDLRKKVQRSRKNTDIIIVQGGDLKINRAACEDRRIDVLSQPYSSRRDTGINHILAKKASENDVAIELNLKYLLKTNSRHKYRVISQFRHILQLHRKFNFPLIITSCATSRYDLKSPKDIFALVKCLGMSFDETFNAISTTPKNIIKINDDRDSYVMKDVRIV